MADTSLPPFSGRNSSCPKCGASVCATWHDIGFKRGFTCEPFAADEHMCRQCSHCGYGWMEATQDSAPTPLHRVLR